MASAYCPSAVAVSAAATASSAATLNPIFSSHSNLRLFYRFAPKSFKLVANCPNSLFLNSNIRRHRFFCTAPDIEASSADDEIESSLEDEEEEEEVEEEDADVKETTQASVEEGRLYVGNLPYTITSSELSQLFGEAGNVVDVQVYIFFISNLR